MKKSALIFLFICSLCYAENDEVLNLGPGLENLLPQGLVNGCVDALTGTYLDSEVDLQVSSVDPLTFQRHYKHSRREYQGPYIFEEFGVGTTVSHPYCVGGYHQRGFLDSNGSFYLFNPKFFQTTTIGNQAYQQHLFEGYFEKGCTNIHNKGIGGRFHLKNVYLASKRHSKYQESYYVILPDGTQRYYDTPKVRNLGQKFYLKHEHLPSGNVLRYHYTPSWQLESLSLCSSGSEKTLANLNFSYKGGQVSKILASDGQWVQYEYDQSPHLDLAFHGDLCPTRIYKPWPFIKAVHYSNKPSLHYHFDKSKHTLTKRHQSGSYIKTAFLSWGDLLESQPLKIKLSRGYIDPRYRKVYAQYAPVGPSGEREKIASFHYFGDEKNNHFHSYHKTEVYDVYGNLTVYQGSYEGRLTSIYFYQKEQSRQKLCKAEKYFWGEKGSLSEGDLIAKAHLDENEEVVSGYFLDYDEAHNVKEKHFYGNLSGKSQGKIVLDERGVPQGWKRESHPTLEVFSQYFTYNKHHLLIQKKQGKLVTELQYYPANRKLKSVFLKENHTIIKRNFYTYDALGALIQKIEDDGKTKEESNVQGVSYRKIEVYKLDKNSSLAKEVKEFYYCPHRKQRFLKKVIKLEHDALGRETFYKLCDPQGKKLYQSKKKYNRWGQLIEELQAGKQPLEKIYNSSGLLVKEKQGKKCIRYLYDKVGRLFRQEDHSLDRNGKALPVTWVQYRYDKANHLACEKHSNGYVKTFDYDALSNLIREEEKGLFNGKECGEKSTVRHYNSQGHIIKKIELQGFKELMRYNAYGKKTFHQHQDGRQEQWRYFLDGKLKSHKNPQGISLYYHYDALDRIHTIETFDSQGKKVRTLHNVYQGFYLVKTQQSDVEDISYSYDVFGRKIQERQGDKLTHFSYDFLDRLVKKRVYSSSEDYVDFVFKYDESGRVIEEKALDKHQELQRKTEKDYHPDGYLAKERHYHNQEKFAQYCYEYNGRGEIEWYQDPLGHESHYHYLPHFNLSKVLKKVCAIDPMGNSLERVFNAKDQLVSQKLFDNKRQLQKASVYVYNKGGLLIFQQEQNLSKGQPFTLEFSYDRGGRLIQKKEGKNLVTRYHYDALGRLTKTLLPSKREIHLDYDKLSRLKKRKAGSHAYCYHYDAQDRVTQVEEYQSEGKFTSRCHLDSHGRVLKEELSNGLEIHFTFDAMDRITSLSWDNQALHYLYEGLNLKQVLRLTENQEKGRVVFSQNNLQGQVQRVLCRGEEKALQYDLLGRRVSLQSKGYCENQLQFDACGNLRLFLQNDQLTSLNYDAAFRLIQEKKPGGSQAYVYDSLGNRIEKNTSCMKVNDSCQLIEDGTYHYLYDEDGKLLEKKGEQEHLVFSYTPFGLLESIEKKGCVYHKFYYDYQDRLIKQRSYAFNPEINDYEKEGSENRFLYLKDVEIGCIKQGKLESFRWVTPKHLGEVGATQVIELKQTPYLVYHDYQGSVKAIKDLHSHQLFSYHYSSFGEGLQEDESDNPWKFLGKRELLPQYYFFGKRLYDASTGRFITKDPKGLSEGMNPYLYADNRPYYFTDIQGFSKKNITPSSFSQNPFASNVVVQMVNGSGLVRYIEKQSGHDPDKGVMVYSQQAVSGSENQEAIIFVNGMATSAQQAKSQSDFIMSYAPSHTSLTHIYNYNCGHLFLDVVKGCFEKLGIKTRPVRDLERVCRHYFSQVSDDQRLTVIAYSGGNIVSKLAFESLSEDIRQRIDFLGLAPGAYISSDLLPHAKFVVGEDPIPLLGGVLGRGDNVCYAHPQGEGSVDGKTWVIGNHELKSLPRRLWKQGVQHSFFSPQYTKELVNFIQKFPQHKEEDIFKASISLIVKGY